MLSRTTRRARISSKSADSFGKRRYSSLPPPKVLPQRRVVVTGLGLVTPLGVGVPINWTRILNGESGVSTLPQAILDQITKVPVKIGACIKRGTEEGAFDASKFLTREELHAMPSFIQFAVVAAGEALAQAGLTQPIEGLDKTRIGVSVGSGIAGIEDIEKTTLTMASPEGGYRRVSPYYVPRILANLPAGHISIKYCLQGPNHCVSTACATGAHSIGDSYHMIRRGDADVMVAGATESCITPVSIAGFAKCKALATRYNDNPAAASRPFDKDRDGFVLGEGAGVVILEEYEHAKARGAPMLAELRGYGMSGDAHHITAPAENGEGARRSMEAAIQMSGLSPSHIDYINAHATSTPLGDKIETLAIKSLFGDHAAQLAVSSTKGATGHLIAAAGVVEAIFSILAIRDSIAPPTINLTSPEPGLDLNYVPNKPQKRPIRAALSNSFGFGGTNATVVFAKL